MTDQRFKIVFSGELMPDASLETVKDNLARLFKSEPGKIDALFGGRPVVLKRELPEAEAERYLTALRQAGANAYKEVDLAASLSLVETPDHNPQVAEETPAQDLPPMTCPKCGHEQPSGRNVRPAASSSRSTWHARRSSAKTPRLRPPRLRARLPTHHPAPRSATPSPSSAS